MAHTGSIVFLSHGGGPLPLLGDDGHREMVALLEQLGQQLPRPDAIVVISAHWEADYPLVTAGASPALIYDYYGFPEAAYEIQYPAPGSPPLARRIDQLLAASGIESGRNKGRGFDHGLFVPLKIMYPQADIPCVQLSLVNSLDPLLHLQIGRALAPLLQDNILIVGSGFSFHNLKAFFTPATSEGDSLNAQFEGWLQETLTAPALSEAERDRRLTHWKLAPGASYCHPREEHLLPLHVCYGAAQAPPTEACAIRILGKLSSVFVWRGKP